MASRPRLSREKIALIHIAKQQVGMDESAYRTLLHNAAAVSSSTELTEKGFRAVMNGFERLGFQSSSHVSSAGDDRRRPGMATPKQTSYIRGLWFEWLGREDDRALGRWMQARYGISDLRFADVIAAQKAIEGLLAMTARRAAKEQQS